MTELQPLWRCEGESVLVTEAMVDLSVLRVRAPPPPITDALGAAFGLTWPTQPNTLAGAAPPVVWLSHGEWGVFAPADQIRTKVVEACTGHNHLLVDVSAGRRLWRIEGPKSRDLIATACALDTHPSVLCTGQSAQSLFADVHALLIPLGGSMGFDLVADASFEGHLRAWFADAYREIN